MKTKTVKVYSFDELSDEAKQRAKSDYAAINGYGYSEEMLASLSALAKHFGGSLSDYSIDWFKCSPSSASFDMPEMERDDIANKLAALGSYNAKTLCGNGDCVLTGYCGDEDAIDGFRKAFFAGESDLQKLMQAAFKTWLDSAQKDCEMFYEVEHFAEHASINNFEFYEDGTIA